MYFPAEMGEANSNPPKTNISNSLTSTLTCAYERVRNFRVKNLVYALNG